MSFQLLSFLPHRAGNAQKYTWPCLNLYLLKSTVTTGSFVFGSSEVFQVVLEKAWDGLCKAVYQACRAEAGSSLQCGHVVNARWTGGKLMGGLWSMGPAFPQACFPSLTLSMLFSLIPPFHSSYPFCLPVYECIYLLFPGSVLCTYHWQSSGDLNVTSIELGKQHAKQVCVFSLYYLYFCYISLLPAVLMLIFRLYNHTFSTIVTLVGPDLESSLWKGLYSEQHELSFKV